MHPNPFPSPEPLYGAKEVVTPKTRVVRFADGYEHRIGFGLSEHQTPRVFNYKFRNQGTLINTMVNFLKERGADKDSFELLANDHGVFVCEKFTTTRVGHDIFELQAEFREVFEP